MDQALHRGHGEHVGLRAAPAVAECSIDPKLPLRLMKRNSALGRDVEKPRGSFDDAAEGRSSWRSQHWAKQSLDCLVASSPSTSDTTGRPRIRLAAGFSRKFQLAPRCVPKTGQRIVGPESAQRQLFGIICSATKDAVERNDTAVSTVIVQPSH